MHMRGYARAKESYEAGKAEKDEAKRPKGAMIDLVREISFDLAREEMKRKLAEQS